MSAGNPPLRPLHGLVALKLAYFERISTEELCASLRPGGEHCLKARPDGTLLDGHHRIAILKQRGVDVDGLPREILRNPELP